jgi:hypothetical protein
MNAIDLRDDRLGAGTTFTLPFLFRGMSIIAFAIAWPLSIATSPPSTIANTLAAVGLVLAIIVGYRRHGTVCVRVGAAGAFFGGALLVALYSAGAASVWQAPVETMHPFDQFGAFLVGTVLSVILPVVLGVLLLLLRAWTWSAHDGIIYQATDRAAPAEDHPCPSELSVVASDSATGHRTDGCAGATHRGTA